MAAPQCGREIREPARDSNERELQSFRFLQFPRKGKQSIQVKKDYTGL
jgi:hypothetical protein